MNFDDMNNDDLERAYRLTKLVNDMQQLFGGQDVDIVLTVTVTHAVMAAKLLNIDRENFLTGAALMFDKCPPSSKFFPPQPGPKN